MLCYNENENIFCKTAMKEPINQHFHNNRMDKDGLCDDWKSMSSSLFSVIDVIDFNQ